MKHSTTFKSNGKYGSQKVDSNDKSDSEILAEEELSLPKVDTGENTHQPATQEAKVAQSTVSVPSKKKNKTLFLLIGTDTVSPRVTISALRPAAICSRLMPVRSRSRSNS